MKKIVLLSLAAILFTALLPAAGFAHPPKNPEIGWNAATHTLTIKASHLVNDTAKHYVIGLVVMNGKGEQLVSKQYTKQTSDKIFCDNVILAALNSGDTVKVRLVCNIMGTAEKEFKLQ